MIRRDFRCEVTESNVKNVSRVRHLIRDLRYRWETKCSQGRSIIGEGQRVECKVRATKTTFDKDPPVFSDYRIVDSDATDRLPDGNYE